MRVSDDDMVAWVGESYDPPFIMEDLVQDLLDARRELAEADQAFSDLTNSTDILLANAREEIERLDSTHPKCQFCDNSASCFGSYERHDQWEFACDDCCGHGNEDGTCYALPSKRIAEMLNAEIKDAERLRGQRDRLAKSVEHLQGCDFPDEVDFRCDGCNEARAALASLEEK